ncbi:fatty acyl-AMP ligase [Actinoplanes regularis]|uniref:fatty acyl-AMP ligase n=1 Tax=Actinoplanes regularis TaxID=52697 RepID=UPI0024A512D8|nr:fatty acyl-AMP ligase [Actinoplanes regularis]GLW33528.1 acyl-CoA synthetase [Actinoplanes regularis]
MTVTAPDVLSSATRTVIGQLRLRAKKNPDQLAYGFLRDGEELAETLTFQQVEEQGRAVGMALAAQGLSGGAAVLLCPTGPDFVRALVGCLFARVAGAPAQVPNRLSSLARIRRMADDAGTTVVLTTAEVKARLENDFAGTPELTGLALIDVAHLAVPGYVELDEPGPQDTALLQYTSGSTGSPKGVAVSHENFLANVAETDELYPCDPDGVVVSWLPLFHDMGLLFGAMLPLCTGTPAYLMTPEAFIRRPARWLEAISRFRGTHAAAPSFAYDLCVEAAAQGLIGDDVDLSSWRCAANGAEPVRWRTVRAFMTAMAPYGLSRTAMSPGYGLAENTLKATGSQPDEEPRALWVDSAELRRNLVVPADETNGQPLVSNGVAVGATRIAIVEPETGRWLPEGRIGEIWISGPCVAGGYFRRPAESAATFAALITDGDQRPHLRTGDLGFLRDGELYVTGRLKDVIIRNGRNYYPQDLELSAEMSVPLLRPNCAAAFSVDDGERERLVVVVEADGRALRRTPAEKLREAVAVAVYEGQRLRTDEIVLIRRGMLPRTTSGKVQRRAARERYLNGEFGGGPQPAA